MPNDALIHLRVPAGLKARWIRESRKDGMRLTDWIVKKVGRLPNDCNCQRCGYPPGDDWLDDGETCPNCKLVQ